METGEAGAPGGPATAARPAAGQTPSPSQATPGPKESRYVVVAATYTTMKQAETLQQRLRAKNHRAVVKIQKAGDKIQYQVRVGPLTGAKAAEDAANRIKTQEKLSPKVMKLPPKTAGANNVRRPSR